MGTITMQVSGASSSPPSTIGDVDLIIDSNSVYTFTVEDFTSETDFDFVSSPPLNIKILYLLFTGKDLKLNNVLVSNNQEIPVSDITLGNLEYDPNLISEEIVFTFTISDTDSGEYPETSFGTMTITSTDLTVNNPPTQVGNNTEDVDLGEEYTFTRNSLTSALDPPYLDPEGDTAKRLKINLAPSTGSLYIGNILITTGDVILFSDIDLGLFKYKTDLGIDPDTLDSFQFSISDSLTENNFVG